MLQRKKDLEKRLAFWDKKNGGSSEQLMCSELFIFRNIPQFSPKLTSNVWCKEVYYDYQVKGDSQ
jgi:hypothetical protein